MVDMLAEPDELRMFLGLSDAELDDERAELAIQLATALVQREAAQRIVLVADDTVELTPSRGQHLVLPERPVVEITLIEVMEHGSEIWGPLVASPTWQQINLSVWSDQAWSYWHRVRVTYSHGYAVIPPALKTVALGIACRVVNNPVGVRSETIGSYSYTLAGNAEGAGAALTAYERSVCRSYRLRTAAMH